MSSESPNDAEFRLAAVASSDGAIITQDLTGTITSWNRAAQQTFGYSSTEAVGQSIRLIIPRELQGENDDMLRRIKTGESLDHYDTVRVRKDGQHIDVTLTVSPLATAGGEIVGASRISRAITERRRLEHDATYLLAIVQSSNDAIVSKDVNGTITSWNRAAERLFGYTAAEAIGQSIRLIIPADRQAEEDRVLDIVRRGEIVDHFETLRLRKDGTLVPISLTVSPIHSATGTIVGMSKIARELTITRRHEALPTTGVLQSAIFNSATFSSIATDAKGVIQIFNVGAERMLGYAAADVLNKITPADISDPQEVIARAEALSAELSTPITPGFEALVFKASRGIEDIYELTYIRKDGSRFPAVVSVTALHDAQDAIIGYLLIGTDNTAHKKAEEALREAGALQRAIFNSATFSSIATDAKGVIQIFNVGAERMLGYSAGDVMNKMTPADISDPQEVIARAEALSVEFSMPITPGFEALVFKASRGVEDIYSLTYIRKDGSRFPAIVSVTALRDVQDSVIGYLLIGTDNSVPEQAEAQLYLQGAALNAAANAIVITDDAGVIEWVNPAFSDLTGYTAAEAVGKNPRDLVKSDHHDRSFHKNLWDTILSGRVWHGETINRRKDGSLYTEEQTITPVRNSQGEIRHFIAVKQDITERKRAEEAFRKGEEKLRQSEILNRSLVEHLPQRMFVKDLNLNYVFCNAAYARDLGIEPTQIVGKDDFAFFSRELAEAYRADDRRVMTDGKIRALDEQYTVTGEQQWIHTVKVPYRNEQGKIVGVLGLFEDISERKRVEVQRERLAALVDASPDFIGYADPKTTQIKYINSGGRKMCGIGKDEDIGKLKLSDVHPAWMNQRLTEVVLPAAVRDGLWEGDGAFLHRDGREVPVSMALLAHRGTDGEVDFFYTVSRDITKWNQAVAALRTAEERMRFALEAAGIGIWDMDYTTGVLRWSETLEAHYGLQPGTFGGTFQALVDRIHPDDRESALRVIEKAVKSGGDFQRLNRALWPDGTVRWLSGTGRILLGEHGEPVRGVGISQDVTERHALEDQFQQAQKMEAIGRLAGGVAHDFNNLLTVILGFCELLLADRDPGDPGQADIAEIQKAGTRAAGLTRQLLAFSRKQIIQPTLLDLNVVVADMRSMLGRLIGEDVKVVLGLGPELALVKADRGQVEQIVMNLAVNARDAMPKGGTLTIETANVELDEHYAATHLAVKPGPYVGLTVTDNGTGMTPQVQARLFEPFFTTKEPGKGTGLGMATVYGIVTGSGGSVGVYSEVGKGTSFKVYFPRAHAAEGVVVAPPPVNRRRVEGQTVLVVEDAEGVRELTRRLLQRLGYTVLVAANADEALRLFEQHPAIDLLLTDVVMPGASGPELTKRLVEERRALRVIYMSGYTEEAIVQHGVLRPGIAFLHKPFTSETLGQKIREVLER